MNSWEMYLAISDKSSHSVPDTILVGEAPGSVPWNSHSVGKVQLVRHVVHNFKHEPGVGHVVWIQWIIYKYLPRRILKQVRMIA